MALVSPILPFSLAFMTDVQIMGGRYTLDNHANISEEQCIKLGTENDKCDYINYHFAEKKCTLHSYFKYALKAKAVSGKNFCDPQSRETCK